MVQASQSPSPERAALLHWTARMGAVTAEALAEHCGTTVGVARARLLAAARRRLIVYRRPLTGLPALYTVTASGMRLAGAERLDPCRVTVSNARHLIECARAASSLERCYPDYRLAGERELRRDERDRGRPLASARLGRGGVDGSLLHRPDLVLWPQGEEPGLPIAVEVELTVKAPRRLAEICTAWARCRCVAGVIYLATPEVERALGRAIERTDSRARVAVVPLAALPPAAIPSA